MQLINKIDDLIKWANHRIDFLKIDYDVKNLDRWDDGYHRGYIAAMNRYVDDLNNLKNIIIEINKDDDDV
jgi:predicted heme/steroid binding protein